MFYIIYKLSEKVTSNLNNLKAEVIFRKQFSILCRVVKHKKCYVDNQFDRNYAQHVLKEDHNFYEHFQSSHTENK